MHSILSLPPTAAAGSDSSSDDSKVHIVVASESVNFNNVSYDYIDGKVKVWPECLVGCLKLCGVQLEHVGNCSYPSSSTIFITTRDKCTHNSLLLLCPSREPVSTLWMATSGHRYNLSIFDTLVSTPHTPALITVSHDFTLQPHWLFLYGTWEQTDVGSFAKSSLCLFRRGWPVTLDVGGNYLTF